MFEITDGEGDSITIHDAGRLTRLITASEFLDPQLQYPQILTMVGKAHKTLAQHELVPESKRNSRHENSQADIRLYH